MTRQRPENVCSIVCMRSRISGWPGPIMTSWMLRSSIGVRASARTSNPLSESKRPMIASSGVRGPLSSFIACCTAALHFFLPMVGSLSSDPNGCASSGSVEGSHAR